MTPLRLSIALHYHYATTDFLDGDFTAPAVGEAMSEFLRQGLLKEAPSPQQGQTAMPAEWVATERLTVFVKALTEIPLPVQAWVMPALEPHK